MKKTALILLFAASTAMALQLPRVPSDLRVPALRADYIAAHFWDNLDDGSAAANADSMTAFIADWATVFPHMSGDSARREACNILASIIVKAGEKQAYTLGEALETVLLKSPQRDDALYATALRSLLDAGTPDSLRCRYMLEMTLKNMPGTPAADFTYTSSGADAKLSDLRGRRVLLFFYDPDCEVCHALADDFRTDPVLNSRLASSDIAVLAIAPEGNGSDETKWLPETWIAADDKGTIAADELYDTGSYPCLYLIDTDGTVILKDARPAEVITVLAK